jgi:hypothetical protein
VNPSLEAAGKTSCFSRSVKYLSNSASCELFRRSRIIRASSQYSALRLAPAGAAASGVQLGQTAELVSKIVELQRYVDFRLAKERDRFLQVIAFLSRHAHFFALDLRLHLEL